MKRIRTIHFDKAADVPNSNLPVLLYRSVLASHAASKVRTFRGRFEANLWTGSWTDTIYDYTHFHSNAHEVLGIAEGKVTLRLGGDGGSLVRLKAGDRVSASDVKAIGAYPRVQSHYDMKREGRRIPKVKLPLTDPFYGVDGPLTTVWPVGAASRRRKD